MKKLGKIIATALAFGVFLCEFGVDAKKITDEERLRRSIESSILESAVVRTKRSLPGRKEVSSARKKAIVSVCDRRLGLLRAILVRGGVERSEVPSIIGNYLGACGVGDSSYEASQMRISDNPADLRYNIEVLIGIYESIKQKYISSPATKDVPRDEHVPTHHLERRQNRKGEYRGGGRFRRR